MLLAQREPAQLVILQAVTGTFNFDHAVGLLRGPELNQVRHAGTIGFDVLQQTLEPDFQMLRRQAQQSIVQEALAHIVPGHKR